jgi:hypothetical protein
MIIPSFYFYSVFEYLLLINLTAKRSQFIIILNRHFDRVPVVCKEKSFIIKIKGSLIIIKKVVTAANSIINQTVLNSNFVFNNLIITKFLIKT